MRRFNVLNGQLPVKHERSGYGWSGRRGVLTFSAVAAAQAASVSVSPDSGKLGVRPPGGGPDRLDFRRGDALDHQLINESTAEARVLILPTMRDRSGCAYPDSGKLSTPAGVFRIAEAVDRWAGESIS